MFGFTEKDTAEDIMNTRIATIASSKTVGDAVKEMITNNTRKIIVSDGNNPTGILETMKINKRDLGKTISDMKLSKIHVIQQDTGMDKIRQLMRNNSALLVLDKQQKSKGIITYADWMKGKGLL